MWYIFTCHNKNSGLKTVSRSLREVAGEGASVDEYDGYKRVDNVHQRCTTL